MTTAARFPRVPWPGARIRAPGPSSLALVVICSLAITAGILRVVHRGHIDSFFTTGWLAVEVIVALVYAGAGALVLRRGGSRAIGVLFMIAAAGNAVSAFATQYGAHGLYYHVGSLPQPALVSSLQSWVWLPGNLLLATLVPLLLPDGRLRPGRRWRWLAIAAVAGTLLRLPSHATNPWPWPLGPPANPLAVTGEGAHQLLRVANGVGMALVVVAAVGGLLSIAAHLRTGDPARRAQLRWLFAGSAAVVLTVLLEPINLIGGELPGLDVAAQLLQVIALPLLPLTTAVAVLRHRLWGIDAVLNRAVFWMAASAAVLVLFAGSITVAGVLLGSRGVTASALAAGMVAVAFQPIRTRLQASVDRMVYGERGDPLAVVRRLGVSLRAAGGPDSALQQVAGTLGRSLDLEMVGIDLVGPQPATRVAQWGPEREPDAVFPLAYRGDVVGEMLIACRPGDGVSPRFRAAIEDLCPQVAAVVTASRFEHELVRANHRIVTARDDERRRLRRDLHDGLGPALAGMALGLTAARNHLDRGEGDRAIGILDEMTAELEAKTGQIRAIVYGLRPPQLDDLGLVGAIEHHLRPYEASGVALSFEADADLPELAAAVESAAYHVVVGAVDNAVRHAQARACMVRLAVAGDQLHVEVADDGRGMGDLEGVGIRSMRERAAAVDGVLVIGAGAGAGTTVTASFPLASP